jgi:hypothetical protein
VFRLRTLMRKIVEEFLEWLRLFKESLESSRQKTSRNYAVIAARRLSGHPAWCFSTRTAPGWTAYGRVVEGKHHR